MSDIVDATCGLCGKGFKLRPDQLGREVLCPHCKTIVVIEKPTEFAREAVEVLGAKIMGKRPVTARRHVVMPRGGVRNVGVLVAWAVLLVAVLIGVIVAWVVLRDSGGPSGRPAEAPAPRPSPAPPVRVVRPPPVRVTEEGPAVEPDPPPPAPGGISVTVEGRPLDGFAGGTLTYVVGKVANNTGQEAHGIQVAVRMTGEGGQTVGTATALVRRLMPGEQVPYVAAWRHGPDVRALACTPGHTVAGPASGETPPRLAVGGEIWPKADAAEFARTGDLIVPVLNAGQYTVSRIEIWAIIRDSKGGVLSAARDEVSETIIPGNAAEVRIRYENALKSQVGRIEAYVQAVPAP
jgi:hypothetical protein